MADAMLSLDDLIAGSLLDAGAVGLSADRPFRLTSGKLSPIYFDCRRLTSHPAAMNMVAGVFQCLIARMGAAVDVVAGGESAGIPFADRLATLMGKPMVYVRKEVREHGTNSAVEGGTVSGANVILVEDLVTDGVSKLAFIRGLRDAGAIVSHCMVVVDREQGGAEALAAENVRLVGLITAPRILEYAAKNGAISTSSYDSMMKYLKDPAGWRPQNGD